MQSCESSLLLWSLPGKVDLLCTIAYVLTAQHSPGIYEEWEDCKKQVHKFSGNCYKGYATRQEAEAKWRNYQSKNKNKMKTLVMLLLLLTIVAAVVYFILV